MLHRWRNGLNFMKACILQACAPVNDRPLSFGDMDKPQPARGEILIRVLACGVCRTDLHVVEGDLEPRKQPVIPGHQVVGTIADLGSCVKGWAIGDRVGVAWLHRTCGDCRHCRSGRENLCDRMDFTGWTVDGGFAEYMAADARFVYRIPAALSATLAAPLLCAGIIGFRCLRQCEIADWRGARLGLYGFGAAGHIAIQIARARGAEVYVCTRDRERHQRLAEELGAKWVGGAYDEPPDKLDASIIFAPAGEIVPSALTALDRGGRLVLGGIHMSPIPEIEYRDLYWERVIRSVANNTREDGKAFLEEAARVGVRTSVQAFALADANDALIKLKDDAIRGAAVLVVSDA